MSLVLLSSGAVHAVAAYGCMELKSVILQQVFLELELSDVLSLYMGDGGYDLVSTGCHKKTLPCLSSNMSIIVCS